MAGALLSVGRPVWAAGDKVFNVLSDNRGKVVREDKILNAFYYRAHMYTLVPRHVCEDLKWMADLGTNYVTIAVLEQDFEAAVENIDFICNEAAKLGMGVMAVPSRWAGILAGSPKVPSVFTTQHPETWVCREDGTPEDSSVSGRISSIHHPATLDFMMRTVERMLRKWDFKGVIWDELKTLTLDYSPAAKERLGSNPTLEGQTAANAKFYSTINKHIKEHFPSVLTNMFIYAQSDQSIVDRLARTEYLDYFGCDGRPWRVEDGGKQESRGKVLVGAQGQRYIDAAHTNRKGALFLIENHNMSMEDVPILEKRMPELLEMDVDHLIYYYYPRNLEDPDRIMNIMKKHLSKWK